MFEKEDLIRIANETMPFGKYKGMRLIDLPEPYLLWFSNKGFPNGRLGEQMALTLAIKTEGLEGLVKPLKQPLT
ncbi:MAG: cytoplasmic protein [Gammaproteobacteria bacterium]|nr:cytoplasmic protein [Kiritimatiellia bacterium]NKB62065.1 cytoplasmic protein [Gammaproteobacteria bacterium]